MMGRWKEEMEVEFVKLSNRVETLEAEIKRFADEARAKYPLAKSQKQIQDDWNARHGDMLKDPLPHDGRYDKHPPDISHFEQKAAASNNNTHDRSHFGPVHHAMPTLRRNTQEYFEI
jgi:hypothetical protein